MTLNKKIEEIIVDKINEIIETELVDIRNNSAKAKEIIEMMIESELNNHDI